MTDITIEDLVFDDRVRSRVYTDPDVFEMELRRIFYRTWIYVAHASEIGEPGDYVTRRIGRQPVVVVRGQDDRVRVLLNRCPHRGNTVCQFAQGNARAFRCAYHGWTFDNRGTLVGATYRSGYGDDFDQASMNMTELPRVDAHRGFVFASFTSDGPDLLTHLGRAADYIDHFVDLSPTGEISLRAGALKTRFRANWKMPVENAVDGYHPIFLHRSVFRSSARNSNVRPDDAYGDDSTIVTRDLGDGHAMLDFSNQTRETGQILQIWNAESSEDERRYEQRLVERLGEKRAKQLLSDGLSNVVIFPNLVLAFQDVRIIEPISPTETVMYQYPALLPEAPDSLNAIRLRGAVAGWGPAGNMAPDDFEVYERNQAAFGENLLNEWVVLSRGLHRAHVQDDGTLVASASDEVPQRAIWRQYRAAMATS